MQDFRLKVFYEVAKQGSFSKAAGELYISQPAVSKNIKELETQLGTRLFDRKHHAVTLTEAGKLVLRHARVVCGLYDELEYELSLLKGGPAGRLSIGASSTVCEYVLPTVLTEYYAFYSDIRVQMLNGNSQKIEQKLLNGDITLGFVEGTHSHPELSYQAFMSDEIICVTSDQSLINGPLSFNQFLQLPLILREQGSGTLEVLNHYLQKVGTKVDQLNVKMRIASVEAIKNLIKSLNMASILPAVSVKKELEAGVLRQLPISGVHLTREFRMAYLKGPKPEGQAGHFVEFINNFMQRASC